MKHSFLSLFPIIRYRLRALLSILLTQSAAFRINPRRTGESGRAHGFLFFYMFNEDCAISSQVVCFTFLFWNLRRRVLKMKRKPTRRPRAAFTSPPTWHNGTSRMILMKWKWFDSGGCFFTFQITEECVQLRSSLYFDEIARKSRIFTVRNVTKDEMLSTKDKMYTSF